ncbi:hypothetical protein ACFWUU_28100 [Kribbella sp. NPDC058693]|uniref:hypothetical protein n=1 Tax=Kribbella sp. NPDC058693 TaxID=3346602 RepID=UPI00364EF26E
MRLGFRLGAEVVLVAGAVGATWFLLDEGLDRAQKWVCQVLVRAGRDCAVEAV